MRMFGQATIGFLFLCSQTLTPFANAKPLPENCAQALILTAAKKNVKEKYNNRPYGGGYCALGVRQSLQLSKVGSITGGLGNAIDYVNNLPPHGFVATGNKDPKTAPPGAVIVFSGPHSADYLKDGDYGSPIGDWVGHVTIKGDDGYYYTDGRTDEPANGWSNDRNVSKKRNVAAIFVPGAGLVTQYNGKCLRLASGLEDLMLSKSVLITSLLTASTAAFAASASSSADCRDCSTATQISTDLRQLSFLQKSDRVKARRSIEPALDEVRKFQALSTDDRQRTQKFQSLLNLARELGPYDIEGQITQTLAKKIAAEPALRSTYSEFVDSMRASATSKVDQCKTTALVAAVTETLCMQSQGVRGQDHDAVNVQKCIQAFNFEDCLSK